MLMCILAQQETQVSIRNYIGFKPNHPTWARMTSYEDSDKESYFQQFASII